MESLTFENLFSKEDIESALTELEAKRDSSGIWLRSGSM